LKKQLSTTTQTIQQYLNNLTTNRTATTTTHNILLLKVCKMIFGFMALTGNPASRTKHGINILKRHEVVQSIF
jgi:hypothetical protein